MDGLGFDDFFAVDRDAAHSQHARSPALAVSPFVRLRFWPTKPAHCARRMCRMRGGLVCTISRLIFRLRFDHAGLRAHFDVDGLTAWDAGGLLAAFTGIFLARLLFAVAAADALAAMRSSVHQRSLLYSGCHRGLCRIRGERRLRLQVPQVRIHDYLTVVAQIHGFNFAELLPPLAHVG